MRKRRSPWISTPALLAATAGLAAALTVYAMAVSGSSFLRLGTAALLAIVIYTIAVLTVFRRREIEDTRLLLELQEELRFSQDHIMANETHRSLSAYLEIAAHQMKEPLRA